MRGISLFLSLVVSVSGQTSSPSDPSPTLKKGSFFSGPDFFVAKSEGPVPHLSNAEKFRMTALHSVSPAEFVRYGVLAGISQAEDHEAYYGQGADGFARRYALRVADGTIEDFFTHAIFPAIRHEDPRYFQAGEGSFLHRAAYAFSRIFVTRTDEGDTIVNVSELAGSATAAGVSTFAYHPKGERTIGNALNSWGDHVAFDALRDGVIEFWPDVWRKIKPGKK